MGKHVAGRIEHKFFIRLTDEERERVRANMERLKAEYNISMSAVLRKVLLDHMNDDEFLKFIKMKENT